MQGSRPAPGRRRRADAECARRRQVRVRLSPGEYEAVVAAAARKGVAAGAWVGQVAVRFAVGETDPLPVTWRELVGELLRLRTEVARVGAVINQVARVANATGRLDDQAAEVLGLTRGVLARVDEATAQAVAAGRLVPRTRRRG